MDEDWAVFFFLLSRLLCACVYFYLPVSFVFLLRLLHPVVMVVGSASLAFVTAVDSPPPPRLASSVSGVAPGTFPKHCLPEQKFLKTHTTVLSVLEVSE